MTEKLKTGPKSPYEKEYEKIGKIKVGSSKEISLHESDPLFGTKLHCKLRRDRGSTFKVSVRRLDDHGSKWLIWRVS